MCMLTFQCCCWLGTRRSHCFWVPAWTVAPASLSSPAWVYGWTRHYGTSGCQWGEVDLIAGLHTSGSPSGSSWSASPGTLGQEWEDLCRQKCFQIMSSGLVHSLHYFSCKNFSFSDSIKQKVKFVTFSRVCWEPKVAAKDQVYLWMQQ